MTIRPFILMFFLLSCAQPKPKKEVVKAEDSAAKAIGATNYVSLEFKKGSARLTNKDKIQIKHFLNQINKQHKEIQDIKILTWADQEYPLRSQKSLPSSEIILAKERAERIKNYLKQDLKSEVDVDEYNMARRPNLVSKLFNSEEYILKEAFEKNEVSHRSSDLHANSKARKALVIIDFQKSKLKTYK
ncbi:MAG: hypothetical protein AB7I27_18150 [Bacteriovoracaceae bacterium]